MQVPHSRCLTASAVGFWLFPGVKDLHGAVLGVMRNTHCVVQAGNLLFET